MIDTDLQRRVARLLRGERRTEDLDRLYLGLREHASAHASVREIGHFVAHRGQRDKGPVTGRLRDVFASVRSWLRCMSGILPEPEEIRKIAAANLRIATDKQLHERLALRRSVVISALEQGLRKLERGTRPTERERRVINHLGGSFIWNPAFTDQEILDDFALDLQECKLLSSAEREAFDKVGSFLTLYVVALMHGSSVLLDDGNRIELLAGFGNNQGQLEVKGQLVITDLPKPVYVPVCILWTNLRAADWCINSLLTEAKTWNGPLEVDQDGLLGPLR